MPIYDIWWQLVKLASSGQRWLEFQSISFNFTFYMELILFLLFLVCSRSNSWEYVDLTSSMVKNRGELINESVDVDESLLHKKAKAFYEGASGNATSPVDEENGFSNIYQIREIVNLNFFGDLERTEKMLYHELCIHPPHFKESIGKFKFGSVFESKVCFILCYVIGNWERVEGKPWSNNFYLGI